MIPPRWGNSIRQYQSMLSTNMTEQEKLNALLSQKKNELSERERTINELQDMINAQNEKVKQLLNSVKDALLGFSTDELTVREKDGKVYVAMSDKLLFQSGSARLDKRGEEARQIGGSLEQADRHRRIYRRSHRQ